MEPSRPGGPLVISNVQADSVFLSWKPPLEDGGGSIQGYLIEAKDVLHMDVIIFNFISLNLLEKKKKRKEKEKKICCI